MTLQELYQNIGGDYAQAMRVLLVERLLDKHIRKFPKNGVIESVLTAGENMDPTAMFETAHTVRETTKAVRKEFRAAPLDEAAPRLRKLTDEQVREKLGKMEELYRKTIEGIKQYEEG